MSLLDVFVIMLIIILFPTAVLSLAGIFFAFVTMWEDRKREKDMKRRREAWRKDRK